MALAERHYLRREVGLVQVYQRCQDQLGTLSGDLAGGLLGRRPFLGRQEREHEEPMKAGCPVHFKPPRNGEPGLQGGLSPCSPSWDKCGESSRYHFNSSQHNAPDSPFQPLRIGK